MRSPRTESKLWAEPTREAEARAALLPRAPAAQARPIRASRRSPARRTAAKVRQAGQVRQVAKVAKVAKRASRQAGSCARAAPASAESAGDRGRRARRNRQRSTRWQTPRQNPCRCSLRPSKVAADRRCRVGAEPGMSRGRPAAGAVRTWRGFRKRARARPRSTGPT